MEVANGFIGRTMLDIDDKIYVYLYHDSVFNNCAWSNPIYEW